uniref:PPUP9405 n=1 Tax=Poeciliopsis prolifica TaxID=188132 RepID=A0A0S7ES30_9TELE
MADIITLSDAFTYARSLSELVISVLDDPKISSMVTLTVTVLFIFSSSLTSTLLVVVSVMFSLHWLDIVTLPAYVPSALDNPKVSRAIAATIAAFLTLSNPLIIVLAAFNFVLWFDWLEISTLTEMFTLCSELFMSFINECSDANTCTDSKSEGKDLRSKGVTFEDVREGMRVKLGLPKRNISRKTTQVKVSLVKTDIREAMRVKLGFTKLQIRETVED